MNLLICNDIYEHNRKLIHIVKIVNLDNLECVWYKEGEDYEKLVEQAIDVCKVLQGEYIKEYINNSNQLKLLFDEDSSISS